MVITIPGYTMLAEANRVWDSVSENKIGREVVTG
jgi:hypothetical protein